MTLRIYIAQQLRMSEQLDGVSDKEIDEATNIIEATIVKTPNEIKEMKDSKEQKEAFFRNIKTKKYFEKIVVKYALHIIPKVLTKQTGLSNDIDFVGRKEELQDVDEPLNQDSMLLLLNGIGGYW